MAEETVITKELRDALGTEVEPEVFEVTKRHIKAYADAIGDPNPLWQDEEYAAKSVYGGIVAPPTYHQVSKLFQLIHEVQNLNCPLTKQLYGGSEFDFFTPARPGDVLTIRGKFVDMYERDSAKGKRLFLVFEQTYTNQRGELVSKYRRYFIKFK